MSRILIIDDQQSIREVLEIFFRKQGFAVQTAESGEEGLKHIRSSEFDLIISDIRMPDMSGIDVLREVRAGSSTSQFILLTAYATAETAIQGLKMGAYDYILKTDNFMDELRLVVEKALETRRLREENSYLRSEVGRQRGMGNLIGASPQMQDVFRMIETVSGTNSTVLISGESGTGKELVARAIHSKSPRAGRPFVSVNCGALTESLLESELFGYVKGAFTGAVSNRKGLLEFADKGTVFLDEIGEMSAAMQVKLLRVLQERVIRRVGGTEEVQIDVRVLAATNRDLSGMVRDNQFREDLYYRISVIPVALSPLRERREDIPLLARHFLTKLNASMGKKMDSISPEAMKKLESYEWPGNVRELENALERAFILEPSTQLSASHLPGPGLPERRQKTAPVIPDEGIDLESLVEGVQKSYLEEALRRANGVQIKAADLLRMPYRSFRHYVQKYNVKT